MKDRDLFLLLGGGTLLAWLSSRGKGSSSGSGYTIDYGGEEFQQVLPDGSRKPTGDTGGRVTGPATSAPPSTSKPSTTKPKPKPSGPPPIPDVESAASRADLERINLDTAAKVLNALGEDFPESGNIFNLDIAQSWADHALALDKWADTAFERASNTKVWIAPKTAQLIANAAKAAREGTSPPPASSTTPSGVTPREQPGDEDDRPASAQDRADQAAADQAALDELARRAAQVAAQQQQTETLPVQTQVPDVPLPNPAPVPINLERARRTAPQVDKNVKAKRDKYDRKLVAQFQADAGLVPDGLYGPVTQSALRHFGVKDPAKPVFKNPNYTTYQPPA